jgi:hypothetical protein
MEVTLETRPVRSEVAVYYKIEEMEMLSRKYSRSQEAFWYRYGILKLVTGWGKCNIVQGYWWHELQVWQR